MSESSIRPGITLGSYPQRRESQLSDFEQAVGGWIERQRDRFKRDRHSQRYVVREVNRYDRSLQRSSDEALTLTARKLRKKLHRQGLQQALILKSFALIRELASRSLGKRHFDVQLYGGWLMMNGMLAEMQTGEGKTLTATLPACTAALAGVPVHVITANDYLAERDCENMRPLYESLGLTSSSVTDGMPPNQCRSAYTADIVHTTNKQIAFDYLRDRIEMGDDTGDLRSQYRRIRCQQGSNTQDQLLLRGLCFAIIDEADSVLIDEANTPLIITRSLPGEDSSEIYGEAIHLASKLVTHRDFKLDVKARAVELTREGEDKLEQRISSLPKTWRNKRKRETLVRQALVADYFYKRDREYLVSDGKVQIVDQSTGRVMPDRAWEQGLHQMIEAKEDCEISQPREPQARISYQKFFSRYLRLGGASGTISEVADELRRVYGLEVRKVATNRPSQRILLGERIYRDEAAKKRALIQRVKSMRERGRPILVGTCSVEESEQVSEWLRQSRVKHRVLNAKQDRHEAEIIAEAGQQRAVTVATNMAGRGTDIELGRGISERGGLHVISLSLNDSRRVDRQLYGRSARQGDPGSAEAILSLQDSALLQYYSKTTLRLLAGLATDRKPIPGLISRLVLRFPQLKQERNQARVRKLLMKQDLRLRRILAFAGKFE